MIDIDVQAATEDIKAAFSSLTGKNAAVATMRAINHTLAKAQTQVSRQIRTVYNIAVKDVNDGLTLIHATESKVIGQIMASTRPIPLVKFNPVEIIGDVQTKWSGSRKKGGFSSKKVKQGPIGVTVEIIRGQPKTIRSAYVVFGGKGAVKAPGQYGASGFEFATEQTHQSARLNTKSVFWAILNQTVENKLTPKIKEDYAIRLTHELEHGIKFNRSNH